MRPYDDAIVIADSVSLTAGEPTSASVDGLPQSTILATLEDLEGAADDTITVRGTGAAGTYRLDQQTLSNVGEGVVVDAPNLDTVEIESSNGVTYSAEVRGR
jgi:hypothetical protein